MNVSEAIRQEYFFPVNNADCEIFKVINYASGNVTSWTDIHASAERGRLVFVSDSAGHPRYRRTTVRGLVGWSPHWTVLCVAADDGENAPSSAGGTSSAQEILGTVSFQTALGLFINQTILTHLCLRLESASTFPKHI